MPWTADALVPTADSASATADGTGGAGGGGTQLATPTVAIDLIAPISARANWGAVANATSYDVRLNGGAPQSVIGTSYTIPGLTPGTPYTVTVVAKAAGFTDSNAGTASFSTPPLGTGGIPVTQLTTVINVTIDATLITASGLGRGEYRLPLSLLRVLPSGSAPGQAIKIYDSKYAGAGASRLVAAGANDDLDLAGGLADPFGNIITFASVMGVLIIAADANTGPLVVGNGPNPAQLWFGATAHTSRLAPRGLKLETADEAGWPIVAGSADVLRIANPGGAPQVYDIVIVGR